MTNEKQPWNLTSVPWEETVSITTHTLKHQGEQTKQALPNHQALLMTWNTRGLEEAVQKDTEKYKLPTTKQKIDDNDATQIFYSRNAWNF